MLLPEKEWYTIAEVAERWGARQEDIEHYLETKRLWATTRLTDAVLSYLGGDGQFDKFPTKYSGRYVIEDFDKVSWDCSDACDLHARSVVVGKYSDIQFNIDDFHEIGAETPIIIPADYKFRFMESYSIKKSDVVIMAREVKLFERKYKTSSGTDDENCTEKNAGIPPYLDPKNPYFSRRLAAAVTAWLEVYGSGNFRNKCGHKAEIEKWLEKHREEYKLSNLAIKEITKIVNKNFDGGYPSQI